MSSVINVVAAGLGVYIVPAAIAQAQVKGVRYVDVQGAKLRARLALGWREGDASAALGNLVGLL
ncbi:LysR substrate-binding domain-containing protein [Paraburkholderia azotifigens]|uniref:LysR substrate-binding domain-containing protein n=1 Tax=Paraburkholderia azotifigens TaxID=2057004 RepID=UPI00317E9114